MMLYPLSVDRWTPVLPEAERAAAQDALESGAILFFPRLPFVPDAAEMRFLSPSWSDAKSKNINLRAGQSLPRGASGSPADLAALGKLLARFSDCAQSLLAALMPSYAGQARRAGTSLRPCEIEGRASSWRKDDTRLHVDAFPSNPTQGLRILRVFSNVNPAGKNRIWRVGAESFETMAQRFLPAIPRQPPGAAWLMQTLRITKSRRSEYDHFMLHLHDAQKADSAYQETSPQQELALPPGSTWIVFTDQVSHAAMSGQHALEQTFHLPVRALARPESSPLRTLERLTGRALA